MKSSSLIAFALLLAVSLCSQAQAARVSGAIFTTTEDGTVVNENHYASKCEVYLDGGPGPNAPAKAAGLPDGLYYFQVTDPSGKQLLSTDSVSNRQYQVLGGVIVAYFGAGGGELPHPTGADQDHGATTISLANESCPADYLDTPNGGGVYKVWATPVLDFVGDASQVDNDCGKGCFHGFIPSKSKTDNFKVAPSTATFCLTLGKELEDEFGAIEYAEGWPMTVTDQMGTSNGYNTGPNGQVEICGLTEGTYLVSEETDPARPFLLLFVDGVDRTNDIETDPMLPFPTYSLTWASGMGDVLIVFRNGGDGGDQ